MKLLYFTLNFASCFTHLENHICTFTEHRVIRRVHGRLFGKLGVKQRCIILTCQRWLERRLNSATRDIFPVTGFKKGMTPNRKGVLGSIPKALISLALERTNMLVSPCYLVLDLSLKQCKVTHYTFKSLRTRSFASFVR